MDRIWIITKRELATFFDSLTAYVMIVIFLGISAIVTPKYMCNTAFL